MKKILTPLLMTLLLFLVAVPKVDAIITDPNDYIIYDSGIMADSVHCSTWEFPSFMTITDNVSVKKVNKWGRHNNSVVDYGYPPKTDVATLKGKVDLWGIVIGQKSGYSGISYTAFLEQPEEERPLFYVNRWKGGWLYGRPTDSIVIRIPTTSDSIFIQGCGTNSFYAIMAYELHRGKDSAWYIGGNWGNVFNLGFKPKHAPGTDSTDIVVLGPHKDWYTSGVEWQGNAFQMRLVNAADQNEDGTMKNKKSERWGFFEGTSINRIKIFGQIEKGSVPEFDGTIAGWDFLYRPKASGTVDLTSFVTDIDGEWEADYYSLYASDLGVVRGMLTASSPSDGMQLGKDCGVKAVMISPAGKNDTVDFTLAEEHANYFQIDVSLQDFQEINLNFDFNLRDAADSCVVAYAVDGADTFTVAGKFAAPEDWDGLTHVSVDLPELTNQSYVTIRILQNNGALDENGQFILANLSINGFDYVEHKEGALNVAYINTIADRIKTFDRAITSDSLDKVILPALMENFNVTYVYPDIYAGISDSAGVNALFADYDVVVLSEFPDADSDIAKACKYLVGNKPLLNLKAMTYNSNSWNWGVAGNGKYDQATPVELRAKVQSNMVFHPVFKNIELDSLKAFNVFDTLFLSRGATSNDFKGLQGFSSYKGPQAYTLAVMEQSPDLACIQEINSNPAAKYVMIGLSAENYENVSEEGVQLIINAVNYIGSGDVFAVPNFNMTSSGATVENTEELIAALAYDYSALNLDIVTIKLKNSTDASGVYEIGNSGMIFPRSSNDLVLQPASGATPSIWGRFYATNGMKLNNLTFKNLTWDGGNTALANYDNASYEPFYFNKADTLTGGITVENCTFKNFNSTSVMKTDNCAGALINAVVFRGNLFENIGGSKASGVDGPTLIEFSDAANYQCDSLLFSKNIVKNFHGNHLFNIPRKGTTAEYDSVWPNFSVVIANNIFYKLGGNATANKHFLIYNGALGGLNAKVKINNNLFYKRWSEQHAPIAYISLPAALATDTQLIEVEVLNNFFYPNNVVSVVDGQALTLSQASAVTPSYNLLTASGLGITDVFIDEEALTISKGSPLFISGTGRTPVGIVERYVDRTESGIIRVTNSFEFRTALSIAIGGDVIEVENNLTDTLGIYQIGQGMAFPQTFGNLTIRAAEGHSPTIFGRLSSNNGTKLNTFLVEGLHWFGGDSGIVNFNSDSYAPFYISTADSIMDAFIVRNCTFTNLDYQPIMRTNNCANALINEVLFEYCTFDNMGWNKASGNQGYHFFQFLSNPTYELDKFTFRENIVKNFHGSQFFNITREGSPSHKGDSTIYVTIENNTFYKIGGTGASARQFLGFNKKPAGFDAYIKINNNLFYKRWSNQNHPISNLALYYPDTDQVLDVQVLKNFFAPDSVCAQKGKTVSLPVSEGDETKVTFERLFTSTLFLDSVFYNEEKLQIDGSTSPLYTAGLNGTYVGAKATYINVDGISKPSVSGKDRNVFTKNGVLYIQTDSKQTVEIYNVLGKLIHCVQVNEGVNAIDGLNTRQIYLVKTNNDVVKVIL
mgnify:FL=1